MPKAELWTFGAPCQDFSVAGRRVGLNGKRSNLIREIFRTLSEIKETDRPEWLIYENVKGMLSSQKGWDFGTILCEMDELGYDGEWQIFNSKNYVPQNRERVYLIGHLRNGSRPKILPIERADTTDSVSICKQDGTSVVIPVLTPNRVNKQQNGRRFKEDNEDMFTLTSQDRHGVAIKQATKQGYDIAYEGDSINLSVPDSKTRRGRVGKQVAQTLDTACNQGVIDTVMTEKYGEIAIRKLTPRECFRLQGWSDDYFDKAEFMNSDSQLYKQAGNGVTVNVVYDIGKRLKEYETIPE